MANVTKREKKTCRQLWSSLDTPGPHWTRTRRRLHTWADRSLSWKDVEAHIADVEDVEYVESHIAEDLSFNFSQVEDIGFEKVCLRLSLACCIVCVSSCWLFFNVVIQLVLCECLVGLISYKKPEFCKFSSQEPTRRTPLLCWCVPLRWIFIPVVLNRSQPTDQDLPK